MAQVFALALILTDFSLTWLIFLLTYHKNIRQGVFFSNMTSFYVIFKTEFSEKSAENLNNSYSFELNKMASISNEIWYEYLNQHILFLINFIIVNILYNFENLTEIETWQENMSSLHFFVYHDTLFGLIWHKNVPYWRKKFNLS